MCVRKRTTLRKAPGLPLRSAAGLDLQHLFDELLGDGRGHLSAGRLADARLAFHDDRDRDGSLLALWAGEADEPRFRRRRIAADLGRTGLAADGDTGDLRFRAGAG